jgi:DNA-binding MarR family transcriptional regulator
LDAISLNPSLNVYEKAVLHAIASQMDVNGDYDDERWMYIADITRRTSISRRQVFRVLANLEERGYLKRQQQKSEETGKNAASLYRFSSKIFIEFEAASNVKVLHGLNRLAR